MPEGETQTTDVASAPETSATEAPTREAMSRDDLAGLFRAELEAERAPAKKIEPAAPEAAAPETESADSVAAEPTTETEQEGAPAEPDPADTAPAAPSGMSEADRAVFDALPPDAKAWIAKREAESRADYTKKTQAVAEMRKATEAVQAKVIGQLQQYDQLLSQFTTPVLAPPDPALRQQDPVAYEEALANYVHNKHLQEAAKVEQARVREEAQAHQAQAQHQYWSEQAAKLRELAPELASNDSKGAQARRDVFAYAQQSGYSKEQLDGASALDMVTLWKAQRYDAAMKAKAQAKPVAAPAPKVMAPGPAKAGGRVNGVAAAVKNLTQNPTREALAAAYRAELAAER